MKNDYLLDSLQAIDKSLVGKAGEHTKKTRQRAWIIPAAAAVLAVLVLGTVLILRPKPMPKAASINLLHSLGEYDPNIVLSYKHDLAVSEGKEVEFEFKYMPPDLTAPEGYEVAYYVEWNPFFMHDGRLYWQTAYSVSKEKYKGELVLWVKERVLKDQTLPIDYNDGEGIASGDFYEVKGYDPAFMLCTPSKQYKDEVEIYVCDNGYSVTYGKDLLEDRFFVSRDLKYIAYEDMDSRYHAWGIRHAFMPGSAEAAALIEALDEAPWCVPYETPEEHEAMFSIYAEGSTVTEWLVRLDLGDISVAVYIYDNGYATVSPVGAGSYYLKLDEEKIRPFMEAMKAGEGELLENNDTLRGLTLEQARKDEAYGRFVPDYIPEGIDFDFCIAEYNVDRKTKETLGTERLLLNYQRDPNDDRYIWVWIGDLEPVEQSIEASEHEPEEEDEGYRGWHIALSDLSADEIRRVSEGRPEDYYYFVVYEGSVSVSVTAFNVSPEELVKVAESCFR